MRRDPIIKIIGVIVLLGLTALLLSGCGQSLSTTQQVQRASESIDEGDLRDAEVRLKSLLQKEGDNADAWLLLGRVAFAQHQYADAVERFDRARSNGADINSVGESLARALLAQGEHEKALETLKAVEPDDDQQRAHIARLRGSAYLGLEQINEAGMAFDAALEAVPDFAPALLGKAEIARRGENTERAHALLDRAMQSTPDYAPAWLAAGRLAYADTDCERAAPALAQYLSFDNAGTPGQLFQARSYLADCQMRAGDMGKARENVKMLLQQGPRSSFANYLQALIDIRDRNYEPAAHHLQQVLAASPDNVRSLTLLASIKLTQDDTNSAELYLNQAIARAPSHVPTLRLLAALYLQRGEDERAIRMLETAYARNPDSDGIRGLLAQVMAKSADEDSTQLADDGALRLDVAAAMARAGNTAAAVALLDGFTPQNEVEVQRAAAIRVGLELRSGHSDKAIEAARELVANAPQDPQALTVLARTYAAAGKTDDAGHTLDRALKIAPENTGLLFERANIHAGQGQYDQASQALERLLALAPGDLRAQLAMARIGAARGDRANAISWLEKAHTSHPDNAQLAIKLVQAYLAAHNNADARALAETLVTDDPDNAAFNRIRGMALLADGRNDDAIDSFTKAARLAPDKPAYRLDLAQAQMSAQRLDAALEQLQGLRREQPTFVPAASALARLQARMGHGQDALKTIDDIPVDNENRAGIKALKGEIFIAQGEYDKAASAYAKAYQAQPTQKRALALFQARRKAGMSEPQVPLVDWLERQPNDTAVMMQLAQWYQANDRSEAAERSYQNLLAVNETNAVALNNLALVRAQLGRDDALTYARRAHKAAPDNAAIADTLGWLLVNNGEVAQGIPLLRTAASAMPDAPSVQYHLAVGLGKTGNDADQARAQAILERILKADTQFSERASARALLDRIAAAVDR